MATKTSFPSGIGWLLASRLYTQISPVFDHIQSVFFAWFWRPRARFLGRTLWTTTFLIPVLWLFSPAEAQTIFTGTASADAFLATGSTNNPTGADLTGRNFGAAGTLAIASGSSLKGEFQSVVEFNLSNAVALFNMTYGSNRWSVTGISLELNSNYGMSGEQPNDATFNWIGVGYFVIEWLSNNSWVEGTGKTKSPTTNGVAFGSLPELLATAHEPLCTNIYWPPGDNVAVAWPLPLTSNLVANVIGGGAVTFRLYADDEKISYLFGSRENGRGNGPLLHVTAVELLDITTAGLSNGVFLLTGIGNNNTSYLIQANADLATTNWQTIGTVTAGATGGITFRLAGETNYPMRLYRLCKPGRP
ncbi:MAG: hypothetical protein WCO56_05040 [Verrucomicrobiota bacterium]